MTILASQSAALAGALKRAGRSANIAQSVVASLSRFREGSGVRPRAAVRAFAVYMEVFVLAFQQVKQQNHRRSRRKLGYIWCKQRHGNHK